MYKAKKMSSETLENSPVHSLKRNQKSNQRRLGKICSSPFDLWPELVGLKANSDIETDDSSKCLNRVFVEEKKQISESLITESPPIPFSNSPQDTQRRMGHRWPSPAYLLHELADLGNESDIDTDDSSKVMSRLFIEDNSWPHAYDPTPSVESDDSVRFIITLDHLDGINSTGPEQNEKKFDPVYKLEVARSLFEERLTQRESQLLKTPETRRFLEILSETILSPISTLLVKLHAPSEWRTCMNCEGFLQTHCCLKSQYFRGYNEELETGIFNFRHLRRLQTYIPYSGIEAEAEEQANYFDLISFC